MTSFKKYKLVDDNAATEGLEVRAEKWGHYVGTFTVRFINQFDQRLEKELTRIRKSHAYLRKQKSLPDIDNLIVVLADYAIMDWKDVLDEEGKQVKFSPELAIEFLSDEDNHWIVYELVVAAYDGSLFQPVEAFDPVKNSHK